MSLFQVHEIMKATQSKGAYGPWKDHFTEMGRKTAIRRLAKYLPLSIEFQTAAALDEQSSTGKDQHLDEALTGDFSVMSDEAPQGDENGNGSVDHDTGEIQGHLSDNAPVDHPQGSGFQPSAEEIAAIRKRELAEAGQAQGQAQTAQQSAPRGRGRQPSFDVE